ncbi:hypothetical protein TNCV_4573061 [Trichonephila clavipes]|nr:hypothetical protein TNCV_4573061 [Trichonephila clavipes]
MHPHTGPAPGIIFRGGTGIHCRISLLRTAGTEQLALGTGYLLEPVILPYIQCLPSAIFRQDNAHHTWHAMSIRLHCFLGLLVLPISCQSKTCGPCLHNDCPGIHHPLKQQINFGEMWKLHELLFFKDILKASLILCQGVWRLH